MTPSQSGSLTVVSSPKGCQGYGANDSLEFAVFILALSLKLLLTADVTANLLFFGQRQALEQKRTLSLPTLAIH
jgi:hypothetical protein